MRRIRGALRPLLKAAPLSKSAVSRIVATLRTGLEAWQTRPLADLEVVYLPNGVLAKDRARAVAVSFDTPHVMAEHRRRVV